jgi:hypothetical protein
VGFCRNLLTSQFRIKWCHATISPIFGLKYGLTGAAFDPAAAPDTKALAAALCLAHALTLDRLAEKLYQNITTIFQNKSRGKRQYSHKLQKIFSAASLLPCSIFSWMDKCTAIP